MSREPLTVYTITFNGHVQLVTTDRKKAVNTAINLRAYAFRRYQNAIDLHISYEN